jgi:hypothetical protein
MARAALPRLCVFLAAALSATACTEQREVENDLRVVDVKTGWYDAGIIETGENKLVPMITLKLQNVSQQAISNVQINAIFRRLGEQEAWGDHFVRAIDSEGLGAGAVGGPLVLRSPRGYTGAQSRVQMLQNTAFVDTKVEIFGKHGSRTWVKMAEYQIERHLITE